MVTRIWLTQRPDLQRRELPGTMDGSKKKETGNFQEILDREIAAAKRAPSK